MTLRRTWIGLQAVILAVAANFSIGINVHAQSIDMRAVAQAKAEGAVQARALAYPPLPQASAVANYTVFDVPGAANGTYPAAISLVGEIAGYFNDANFVGHGFLRVANGTITTFDAPGAVNGTYPTAINLSGEIAGTFYDTNYVGHGFLRAANGVIATFDAPGAINSTSPEAVSLTGEVVGYLFDANFGGHGFIRGPDGNLRTFDAPGASATGFLTGTFLLGVDGLGRIVGNYTNDAGQAKGFLLAPNGKFTELDAPGNAAIFSLYSSDPTLYINPVGIIAGTYFEPIAGNPYGGNYQVFIRALDGTITTFTAASYSPCCIWSFTTGITLENAVVGSYNDGYNINHGFLRAPNGSITTFDAPGAGVGDYQGTIPSGITSLGEIIGSFIDSGGISHGFTLVPGSSALSATR